jgi:hypothetical protein
MTKTLKSAEVVKKGNQWQFLKQGEVIASLGVITFSLKEKLRKDLGKMKYFLPCEDFKRSQTDPPKSGDEKEIQRYNTERQALMTWAPTVMYMHTEDKKDIARKMCSDYLRTETPDEVFVDKFHDILGEFSEILTNFKQYAEKN